nr:M48 family metalloprotease [Methanocaldococcus infernus]
MVLFGLIYVLIELVQSYFIRKLETEADLLASKAVGAKTYIRALCKLHSSNYLPKSFGFLNMFYRHPPLEKRLKRIAKKFNIPEEEVEEIIEKYYRR